MPYDRFANDQNPYAVSATTSGVAGTGYSSEVRVDGELLIVGKKTQLPPICVVTGETDDLVLVTKPLTYVSPVVIFVFILSRLIGLLLYLMLRKQTSVTFYLKRAVRSKLRWKIFYGFLCIVATVVVVIVLTTSRQQVATWLFLIPVVLFIAGLVLVVKGANVLGVKKYAEPENFWIKGCKEPFFESLSQQPELMVSAGF